MDPVSTSYRGSAPQAVAVRLTLEPNGHLLVLTDEAGTLPLSLKEPALLGLLLHLQLLDPPPQPVHLRLVQNQSLAQV